MSWVLLQSSVVSYLGGHHDGGEASVGREWKLAFERIATASEREMMKEESREAVESPKIKDCPEWEHFSHGNQGEVLADVQTARLGG